MVGVPSRAREIMGSMRQNGLGSKAAAFRPWSWMQVSALPSTILRFKLRWSASPCETNQSANPPSWTQRPVKQQSMLWNGFRIVPTHSDGVAQHCMLGKALVTVLPCFAGAVEVPLIDVDVSARKTLLHHNLSDTWRWGPATHALRLRRHGLSSKAHDINDANINDATCCRHVA